MKKYLVIKNVSDKTCKRIFSKIKILVPQACWVWTGATSGRGHYGNVRVNTIGYHTHRFMYAWLVSPIPRGKGKNIPVLDHSCRNRLCCNPDHLQLISDTKNILKGNGVTAQKARQTTCAKGHPLPPSINGHRRCMICHREWNRKSYAKNPQKFIDKVRARYKRLKG